MKKLLTLILLLGIVSTSYTQEAADKEFLAGIVLGGALDFNTPQTNSIDANMGGAFLVGMNIDWSFSDNIGLSSGLEFGFDGFTTTYKEAVYFDYNDKDILQAKDVESGSSYSHFLLKERQHRSIYLTLPVMLKFQTDYLGYMRYYGKFGVRNSFMLSTRTNNDGQGLDKTGKKKEVTELDKMKSPGVMNFYKASIGLAGGVNYNISGGTVLYGEIGYYYGFTEIFQQEGSIFGEDEKGMSLYQRDEKGAKKYYAPSLKQGQLILKIGVLF